MNAAITTKSPAEELLSYLLTKEKVKQDYICYLEKEQEYTTLFIMTDKQINDRTIRE